MKKFAREVQKKEALMIRGRNEKGETVWFGLGMFGIIGWSVAIPTLIGGAVGLWIGPRPGPASSHGPSCCSSPGVMIGCVNAW